MRYAKIIIIMNNYINDNNDCYKNFEKDFNIACNIADENFSHDELVNMLKTGSIPEKQIAAIKFDYVKNRNDVSALLDNLTGCDGKIREAVALKINTLLLYDVQCRELFADIAADTFANATIDINANICRLVINSADTLKAFDEFSEQYTNKIVTYTDDALCKLDEFIFRDKKYVINKQIFKLYWCLEAINIFYSYISDDKLKQILEKCANQNEYTIREKTAQIINTSGKFPELREILSKDENYYVKQILYHPSIFQ